MTHFINNLVPDKNLTCSADVIHPKSTVRTPLRYLVREGELVVVNCSLSFVGGWSPDIVCHSDVFNTTNVINMSSSAKADVSMTFYVDSGYDEGSISCRAKFGDVDSHFPPDGITVSGVDVYYARNTPSFSSTWTSGNISVECK